ncbi:10726_t:CDS:1 [Cetraspora pellucida]|uniref:10726_t:CDS:1 n=1 Tax=Cetraspora pellucida TaxID=1433469 RepID=A0A9N9NXZ8_9GLOM|nr:10726_t:CDS:1 [Cetraspora pellucida]
MSSTIISNNPNNSDCIIISSSNSTSSRKRKHEEISKSSQNIIEIPVSNENCAICLEKRRRTFTIECQHSFCLKCIEVFLYNENNYIITCPLCRYEFDQGEKELYLKIINLKYKIREERKQKILDKIKREFNEEIVMVEREEEDKIINIKRNAKKNRTAIHKKYLKRKKEEEKKEEKLLNELRNSNKNEKQKLFEEKEKAIKLLEEKFNNT